MGKFIYVAELGWGEWDGRRWVLGAASGERAVQAVRLCMDRIERDYRAEAERLRRTWRR